MISSVCVLSMFNQNGRLSKSRKRWLWKLNNNDISIIGFFSMWRFRMWTVGIICGFWTTIWTLHCWYLTFITPRTCIKSKMIWDSRTSKNIVLQHFSWVCNRLVFCSVSNCSYYKGCCHGFFWNTTTQKCERAFIYVINWAEKNYKWLKINCLK